MCAGYSGQDALRENTQVVITERPKRVIDISKQSLDDYSNGLEANQHGPENVTELQLEDIREILDREHDPTIHVSKLAVELLKIGGTGPNVIFGIFYLEPKVGNMRSGSTFLQFLRRIWKFFRVPINKICYQIN